MPCPSEFTALNFWRQSIKLKVTGNVSAAGIAGLKANMEELVMLLSEYSELYNTAPQCTRTTKRKHGHRTIFLLNSG